MISPRQSLAGLAAAAMLFTGACSTDDSPEEKTTATVAVDTAPSVAPYIDIVSGTADIDAINEATGLTDFTLAFVLADSSGDCTASWAGTTALDDATIGAEIDKITALGGEVIVSTGGATGSYLESVCSAGELAAAYGSVLDAAGSNSLDVDIEQSIEPATVTEALKTLQDERGTAITLTVPVGGTQVGLTDASITLLQSAKDAGVEVTVNAMTMNFHADGDWGDAMVTATEAVRDDVAAIWTDRDETQIYAMLGVTPMIGANDTGPVTTVDDVRTLLAYAEDKSLGSVRFWSVNRDNGECPDGAVDAACSGIAQDDHEFGALFAAFAG
ncbi:glycosyl hydrolase [Actinoplanes sp. NBRC 101535]|uniref:glycosyl hydrolase n=1 Tax=Actinoplanes sp. NBRC 101535 TaxID=3032196 RepID=UPI0024A0358A|nr:glycosyl hydrolase [Actinoplanes sp. NBRC 101535]GLY01623.1 hydrolase [Actinoplanes sp. NBRC 101535]